MRTIRAFLRALRTYESDLGGFALCLAWELGFAAGERGAVENQNPYPVNTPKNRAWDHGRYLGWPLRRANR